MADVSTNPVHLQIALQETQTLVQLQLSRAQQLAIELHEARQMIAMLSQQLAEEQSKSNGTDSKLGEIQKTK
jgi:hypothetical protein